MAMPKGFKSENGYGTSKLFDGMTYHEIASTMRESGYKMNHSTARNVFVNALIKVADEIVDTFFDIEKTPSKFLTPWLSLKTRDGTPRIVEKFNEVPKSIYSSFPSKVHIPALSELNCGLFTKVQLFVPIKSVTVVPLPGYDLIFAGSTANTNPSFTILFGVPCEYAIIIRILILNHCS